MPVINPIWFYLMSVCDSVATLANDIMNLFRESKADE